MPKFEFEVNFSVKSYASLTCEEPSLSTQSMAKVVKDHLALFNGFFIFTTAMKTYFISCLLERGLVTKNMFLKSDKNMFMDYLKRLEL